jgi:2-oxoglutarate ferredoxin oxidoreductase subunit beta
MSVEVKDGMFKVFSKPSTMVEKSHHMCPGCGEPIATRLIAQAIEELDIQTRAICTAGIGCYTGMPSTLDIDVVQALHGRAPSVATGVKRTLPESVVFCLQGDGDMVSEGLQEVVHAAARGENFTIVLLNNAGFGETGGHLTATSVPGQRTKSSMMGRNKEMHGMPIRMAELIAPLEGVAYAARGAVHTPAAIGKTKRYLKKAFQSQLDNKGFSFVEILTMCPSGWFIEPEEGPQWLQDKMVPYYPLEEFKT